MNMIYPIKVEIITFDRSDACLFYCRFLYYSTREWHNDVGRGYTAGKKY